MNKTYVRMPIGSAVLLAVVAMTTALDKFYAIEELTTPATTGEIIGAFFALVILFTALSALWRSIKRAFSESETDQ